ncbi:fibronectin type III domain-containing protein [Marinobacter sp. OP 3.4]|uniref:fibronectin type III domain-containing protein n=1 Tax=Marinobacter sp. OP 3.4 TaxID=3076501 RepID=UPI002E1F0120
MVVARLTAALLIATLSLLLGACGGGGSGAGSSSSGTSASSDAPEPDEDRSVTISGYAVKGVISEGIITAWVLDSDGAFVRVGEPVRSDERGYYDLAVPAGHDLIKLELTSDGNTRMRCDAVDGCQGYGGSAAAAFGEDFWPGPNVQLETIVAIDGSDGPTSGHLTPLTTLSTTLFEVTGAGNGWQGVEQAQRQVEAWFGLQAGAVAITPVDITRELPTDLAVTDLEAALVNSAFLGLAEEFPVEGVQGVIDAFRQQLMNTGEIAPDDTNGQPGSDRIRAHAAMHAYTLAESETNTDTLLSAAERLVGTMDDPVNAGTPPDDQPASGDDGATTEDEPDTAPEPEEDLVQQPAPEPTPEPPPETAVARLSWQAPLTRENGNALSMGEIDRYIVRYGTQPDVDQMTNEVIVEDGQAMEYEITDLQQGTWYFVMRTVDQNGLESAWSEVASKTVAQ